METRSANFGDRVENIYYILMVMCLLMTRTFCSLGLVRIKGSFGITFNVLNLHKFPPKYISVMTAFLDICLLYVARYFMFQAPV